MSDLVAHMPDNGAGDADALVRNAAQPIVAMTRGGVQILIFNRPIAKNALTREMRRDFAALLAAADADDEIHAIIVTGAGGAFCAGVDVKESRAQPAPMVRPHPGEALRAMQKPVIAAVDGACTTGGLELALSCSFIIATARSIFADRHAKAGFFPAWGMTALLPRAIGIGRARQMMLTGSPIDAARAYDWGLVNEIVAPGMLLRRCLNLAQEIHTQDWRLARAEMSLLNDAHDGFVQALIAESDAAARWRAEKAAKLE